MKDRLAGLTASARHAGSPLTAILPCKSNRNGFSGIYHQYIIMSFYFQ
ncbi:hypothetical protein B4135_2566 [Caldibacillus debilis]|uniref:Uncharacterized protein n=1 Tax=Caldibacillus debilis TaxID=301148 RepID=A0A150LYC7_9BACI|nr:hypothetical protein B4135_2566 [Caldibacillus debilis]